LVHVSTWEEELRHVYAITQFKAPIVVLLGSHVHAVKVVHVLESINAFAQLVLVVTIAPPVRLIFLLPLYVVLCCAVLCSVVLCCAVISRSH